MQPQWQKVFNTCQVLKTHIKKTHTYTNSLNKHTHTHLVNASTHALTHNKLTCHCELSCSCHGILTPTYK